MLWIFHQPGNLHRFGVLIIAFLCLYPGISIQKPSSALAGAMNRYQGNNRQWCKDLGIAYPPGSLYIRVFKESGQLEVWVAQDKRTPHKLFKTFDFTAQSGSLGSKRREGDRQIPEGIYQIVNFNPFSKFHLSLGIDYPNLSDRRRGKPPLGSDIFIHGGAATIGCVPIGDPGIEQLYALCWSYFRKDRARTPVAMFPFRFPTKAIDSKSYPGVAPEVLTLWKELKSIYWQFERTKIPPEVRIGSHGQYTLIRAP